MEIAMQPLMPWEDHMQRIREHDGIPKAKKPYLLRGWFHLRSVMGESWLESARADRHPWYSDLYWSLFNNTPWVKFHYAQIGYKLNDLLSVPNFKGVLERVRSGEKNVSAMAEVNAAYKLQKEGFKLEFSSPTQKQKTPDISVKHDRRIIGIEVSVLEQPLSVKKRYDLILKLTMIMFSRGVSAGGIIHRDLSTTHANYIVEQLRMSIAQAKEQNQLVVLEIDNVAEFCIVPKHQEDRLLGWKQAHNMDSKMILQMPNLDDNLDRRLHRKILTKSKQIPRNNPGIVYIEGIRLSTGPDFGSFRTPFAMSVIEEAVYENQDLLFVALGYTAPLGTINRMEAGHGIYFNQRNYHNLLSEISLVVTNKFHRWPRFRHKQLINAFWKR